jgi:Uma2 family endonuclease
MLRGEYTLVLSRSTAAVDQRERLMAYLQIESLETYLIVHQDEPRVEYHWRDEDGEWRVGEVIGAGEFPVRSLGIAVSLAALYEGVEFEPVPEDDEDYPAQ